MGNEAINLYKKILENSDNVNKNIRSEIFAILDLGSNEQLNDFVKESLETFSFNLVENQFFEQLLSSVNDELSGNLFKIKAGEAIDYEAMANNLIQSLRRAEQINVFLDDDFRNLANNINNRFPLIASNDWYARLSGKKEQIIEMINKNNKEIVDTLVRLTPQLVSELSTLENKVKTNSNNYENANLQQNESAVSIESAKDNNEEFINSFSKRCEEKLTELKTMFEHGGAAKSEIANIYRDFEKFIANLNNKDFAQSIYDGYNRMNDLAQESIYDYIIFHNVPNFKSIYDKHKGLLDDKNRSVNAPNKPKEPTPVSSYIGASNEEIADLIKQNKYYSLLQEISKEDTLKYSNFINKGYEIYIKDYLSRASNAQTYDQMNSFYFELSDIYQNFKDYLSLEQANQIREQLASMQNYLHEHRMNNQDYGIRYNDSRKSESGYSPRR